MNYYSNLSHSELVITTGGSPRSYEAGRGL